MAKKQKNKKDNKNKLEQEMQEKIDEMMDELENQLGVDKSQIKIVRIDLPKRNFKYILFESLFTILINMLLILSLSGYIDWANYSSIWNLVIFTLILSGIEILLTNMIYLFFRKLVTTSFGLILSLPILIAILCTLLLYKGIKTTSAGSVLFMFTGVLILRSVIKRLSFSYFKKKSIIK